MTSDLLTLPLHRVGASDAPALVLLHAFPVDHRMWLPVVEALDPEVSVLVPDLPGLGGTGLDGFGDPSLDRTADALARTIRAVRLDGVVVAGLSMGGYVALALAERHPDLVLGLGLVDTKSTADSEEARAARLRTADEVDSAGSVDAVRGMATTLLGASTQSARPEQVELVTQWISQQRPDGVAWSQRAMADRPDRTGVLSSLRGPAVVLLGEDDQITPRSEADHMVQALAGRPEGSGGLVVVPRAGHLSALENPAAVASALAGLMGAVQSTS